MNYIPTKEEISFYKGVWLSVSPSNQEYISAAEAKFILDKSLLHNGIIISIMEVANEKKTNYFSKGNLACALRLVSMCQAGINDISVSSLHANKSHVLPPPALQWSPSSVENEHYQTLWNKANLSGGLTISGSEAVNFFLKSGLDRNVLRSIWELSVPVEDNHAMKYFTFVKANRLISLAQTGGPSLVLTHSIPRSKVLQSLMLPLNDTELPLAKYHDSNPLPSRTVPPIISTPVSVPPPIITTTPIDNTYININNNDTNLNNAPLPTPTIHDLNIWEPNSEEVKTYNYLFTVADVNHHNVISGAEAVSFMSKSNLPKPLLREIWSIAASNKVSYLERHDFYIAMRMISMAQAGLKVDIPSFLLHQIANLTLPVFENIPPQPSIVLPSSTSIQNSTFSNLGDIFPLSKPQVPIIEQVKPIHISKTVNYTNKDDDWNAFDEPKVVSLKTTDSNDWGDFETTKESSTPISLAVKPKNSNQVKAKSDSNDWGDFNSTSTTTTSANLTNTSRISNPKTLSTTANKIADVFGSLGDFSVQVLSPRSKSRAENEWGSMQVATVGDKRKDSDSGMLWVDSYNDEPETTADYSDTLAGALNKDSLYEDDVSITSVPCIKGCGFFGTKKTAFMCSSCFKKFGIEIPIEKPKILTFDAFVSSVPKEEPNKMKVLSFDAFVNSPHAKEEEPIESKSITFDAFVSGSLAESKVKGSQQDEWSGFSVPKGTSSSIPIPKTNNSTNAFDAFDDIDTKITKDDEDDNEWGSFSKPNEVLKDENWGTFSSPNSPVKAVFISPSPFVSNSPIKQNDDASLDFPVTLPVVSPLIKLSDEVTWGLPVLSPSNSPVVPSPIKQSDEVSWNLPISSPSKAPMQHSEEEAFGLTMSPSKSPLVSSPLKHSDEVLWEMAVSSPSKFPIISSSPIKMPVITSPSKPSNDWDLGISGSSSKQDSPTEREQSEVSLSGLFIPAPVKMFSPTTNSENASGITSIEATPVPKESFDTEDKWGIQSPTGVGGLFIPTPHRDIKATSLAESHFGRKDSTSEDYSNKLDVEDVSKLTTNRLATSHLDEKSIGGLYLSTSSKFNREAEDSSLETSPVKFSPPKGKDTWEIKLPSSTPTSPLSVLADELFIPSTVSHSDKNNINNTSLDETFASSLSPTSVTNNKIGDVDDWNGSISSRSMTPLSNVGGGESKPHTKNNDFVSSPVSFDLKDFESSPSKNQVSLGLESEEWNSKPSSIVIPNAALLLTPATSPPTKIEISKALDDEWGDFSTNNNNDKNSTSAKVSTSVLVDDDNDWGDFSKETKKDGGIHKESDDWGDFDAAPTTVKIVNNNKKNEDDWGF